MIGGVILCAERMLLEVFSSSAMFGMLFAPFITKWSGGSLYGINMLYYDSLSSYGLLFVRPFRFRISSCPMVLFRLIDVFYVRVVVKMLITSFFIVLSLNASSMIFALNAIFLSDIDLGLVSLHGFLFWVEVALLNI
jgi:hypothetical protein